MWEGHILLGEGVLVIKLFFTLMQSDLHKKFQSSYRWQVKTVASVINFNI